MKLSNEEIGLMRSLMNRAIKHGQLMVTVEERENDEVLDAVSVGGLGLEANDVSSDFGEIVELAMGEGEYDALKPFWRESNDRAEKTKRISSNRGDR